MSGELSDFHSHLMPGVDDGSRNVEDALEGIGRMVDTGVTRIITTPHILGSLTRQPDDLAEVMLDMDEAWNEIQTEASKAFPDIDFRRGHEVMLDIPNPDLSDVRFHLGGTNFVLVEWPRLQIPPGTSQVLAQIVESGLIPVVAHPERYSGIDVHLNVLRSWKQAGAFLQGNYGSLLGRYGGGARTVIHRLLEEGLLDYLSSDFHGRPEYDLFIGPGQEALEGLGAAAATEFLGQINPGRLLDGEPPLAVPPVELERGLIGKLKGWLAG